MRHYAENQLFGVKKAFASSAGREFLRGVQPEVLKLQRPAALSIGDLFVDEPRPSIAGVTRLSAVPREGVQELRTYNPSIARAPRGLCSRCAFVGVVRVDSLHQCNSSSPWRSLETGLSRKAYWFHHTAVVVLSERLRLLGWTWLINSPVMQVVPRGVPVGASDGFDPPTAKSVWDARVVNVGEQLLVSYACAACSFSLSNLVLTGSARSNGGLSQLRAWAVRWRAYPEAWAQGRSQALFVAPSPDAGSPSRLMFQPWLGVLGTFGPLVVERPRTLACPQAGVSMCGHGVGPVPLAAVRPGALRLTRNTSGALSALGLRGFTLSTTAHPVRLERSGGCAIFLGVGHLHRSATRWTYQRGRRRGSRRLPGNTAREGAEGLSEPPLPTQPFHFGYHYTHFWYALDAAAPHDLVATSGEWCIGAAQDAEDCESVQFVSGLSVTEPRRAGRGPAVVLAYGVNDCEARLGTLPQEGVWDALRPVPGRDAVCA